MKRDPAPEFHLPSVGRRKGPKGDEGSKPATWHLDAQTRHRCSRSHLSPKLLFPVAGLLESRKQMEHGTGTKISNNNYRLQEINQNCANGLRQVAESGSSA